jgi:molecular chaperone GrpE
MSEDTETDDKQNGQASAGGGDGAGAPAGAELPPATAEDRAAALAVERDEMKDRMLRIAAEFENWKKRARKEKDDAVTSARESVLREMLEVVDNLERAAQTKAGEGADAGAVMKGVALVLRLFQQKLERYDVKPFDVAGQPFDPRQHEAVSRVESNDVPAGAVAAELQKGYRVGERLLRPALVAVSTGPKAKPEPSGD